jgi:isocitrate/isopropylmalate dehydrogenase
MTDRPRSLQPDGLSDGRGAREGRHVIGYLPGDGVCPEVLREARKAVDASGVPVTWMEMPWGCEYWLEHGRMMPEDALDRIRDLDAVLMGAIGRPARSRPCEPMGLKKLSHNCC